MERDLSKCIMCAKCIRADQELVVQGAIDFMDRGFTSHPATLGDLPLESSECMFCGTCVSICPTGALAEKNRVVSGTVKKSGLNSLLFLRMWLQYQSRS
ncbi:4Fe-4S binding protein [Chloroflexota bacterium]